MTKLHDTWQRDATPARSTRGFTLIELMAVIVILGLLVAIVGPNIWRVVEESTQDAARTQMTDISQAVEMYCLDRRSLPSNLEELTQDSPKSGLPYMKSLPKDPWQQSYVLKVMNASRQEFQIVSAGKDKTWGTEDDITVPQPDLNK